MYSIDEICFSTPLHLSRSRQSGHLTLFMLRSYSPPHVGKGQTGCG
jgi:hypothetical protein